MGELRKPLAGLSPDTARSVQPKPPQVLRSDVAGSLLPGRILPWPWRRAGTPKQPGEEHLNKPLHPHIPERTAIMVQPKLDGERPPSDGS